MNADNGKKVDNELGEGKDKGWQDAKKEKKEQEKEDKKKPAGDFPVPTDDGEGTAMVDPDYSGGGGGPIEFPSPQQIESKLMWNKRPVNPKSGFGPPEIDTSSPPVIVGIDPIALFTGEGGGIGGDGGGGGIFIIGGGYTDPVRPGLGS